MLWPARGLLTASAATNSTHVLRLGCTLSRAVDAPFHRARCVPTDSRRRPMATISSSKLASTPIQLTAPDPVRKLPRLRTRARVAELVDALASGASG